MCFIGSTYTIEKIFNIYICFKFELTFYLSVGNVLNWRKKMKWISTPEKNKTNET